LDDQTYTKDGFGNHRPTISSWLFHGTVQVATSMWFYPVLMLFDLDRYQKSRMGIYELSPPYPFGHLKYREVRNDVPYKPPHA